MGACALQRREHLRAGCFAKITFRIVIEWHQFFATAALAQNSMFFWMSKRFVTPLGLGVFLRNFEIFRRTIYHRETKNVEHRRSVRLKVIGRDRKQTLDENFSCAYSGFTPTQKGRKLHSR